MYTKPLTKRMIEKLKDCHEKHSKDGNPCLQEDLKGSLAALYKRGLINTKMQEINGKLLLCMFLTEAGIMHLQSLDK